MEQLNATWTKCADKMPPDGLMICRYRFENEPEILHKTEGFIIRTFFDEYVNECTEWTPYIKNLWDELKNNA